MATIVEMAVERRRKARFFMNRELRYKVLEDGAVVEAGRGMTFNVSSGGVAFLIEQQLRAGSFIELSISWPALLEGSCPMRLIVFGRVLRSSGRKSACTVDKYEFRTQGRVLQVAPVRTDSMLERWADTVRRESLKSARA